MWRALLVSAVMLAVSTAAWAQDKKADNKPAGEAKDKSPAEKLRDNPNDAEALNEYAGEVFRSVFAIRSSQPKQALQRLDELEAFVNKLSPDQAAAKDLLATVKRAINSQRDNIAIASLSLADLEKQLAANPDDAATLSRLASKIVMELAPIVRSQPDEAAKKLQDAKAIIDKVAAAAKEDATRNQIESIKRNLASLERAIESGKKLTELIGKDAAPLKVEAWVNGTPLTDDDLKGKVVLLDFWAVWCAPCIATFPHLREWNEKYADKGLVMIGMTKYYSFKWDEDAKRGSPAPGTTHEQEQEMLVKFAEHHALKHRFAIMADDSLSEYYGVTGIPHVVVIDQQGKIRLMRVGSGDANAKDIEELLEKLLAGAPAASK
jgi:thiol-disulfide isomerase/thioredoxin